MKTLREPLVQIGVVGVLAVLGVVLLDALGWWDLANNELLIIIVVIVLVTLLLIWIVMPPRPHPGPDPGPE